MANVTAQRLEAIVLDGADPSSADFTSAVLRAYFDAEQMRAFNRLLLRRLTVLALVWVGLGRFVVSLDWEAVFIGLVVMSAGALWGIVSELRATKALRALLRR